MPQIIMPYTVHLDHTLRVTPLSTLFAKGDSAAHRFELTILRAGVQEDLTGCTVMCKFYRMADSTVVSVPGTVEDGKAVAVLGAACYDYIGRFALTIAIKKGEEETTVFYGDGYMHGQRADTSISGEYIIYDINTLLEKIAEIEAATNAANAATNAANAATSNANAATSNANAATSNANAATSNANAAAGKANTAADTASTAAINANIAKDAANTAAARLDGLTATATGLDAGSAPTVDVTTGEDGARVLAFGIPKGDKGDTGATGPQGPKGDTGDIGNLTINGKSPDASGAVALDAGDVGAATAEALSSLKDDISDAWASGTTYAVGDCCISGNRLYKCKTAHTAGSAFNAGYWDAVCVANEITGAIEYAQGRLVVITKTSSSKSISANGTAVYTDIVFDKYSYMEYLFSSYVANHDMIFIGFNKSGFVTAKNEYSAAQDTTITANHFYWMGSVRRI